MDDRPFELRVVRRGPTDYGLALHQRPPASRNGADGGDGWPVLIQVHGTPLKSVLDQVLAALKEAGYRTTDLSRSRREPFALSEPAGVRLGLLFLAVKPLRKVARMSSISEQVRAMTDEEAYYWFSKSTGVGTARRAQRAMRLLLAEE
jgi:hypothetical protein